MVRLTEGQCGWSARFRASRQQIIGWLFNQGGSNLYVVEIAKYIASGGREAILAPKGAKLIPRGGGWYILHGYTQYDKPDIFPDQIERF